MVSQLRIRAQDYGQAGLVPVRKGQVGIKPMRLVADVASELVESAREADGYTDVDGTYVATIPDGDVGFRLKSRIVGAEEMYFFGYPSDVNLADLIANYRVAPDTFQPFNPPSTAADVIARADQAVVDAEQFAQNAGQAATVAATEAVAPVAADLASLTTSLPTTYVASASASDQSSTGFLRLAGTIPGTVPVVKPLGDGRPGVWEMVHDDVDGYLFHLLMGENAGHDTAAIAVGVDNDGIGLLIPNKKLGRGIVGDQRATVVTDGSYWLHVTQRSPASAAIRLEMQANDAAPVVQLLAFGAPGAAQKLLYVSDPSGEAGSIYASDGHIRWLRNVLVSDQSDALPSYIVLGTAAVNNSSNTTRNYLGASSHVFFGKTGAPGQYYPYRLIGSSSQFAIQTASNLTSADPLNPLPTEVATWNTMIGVKNNMLGFFGVTAVARPSAYTQTYATASKTVSAPTANAVVATPAALSSYGFTQAQADALVATVNALVADSLVNKKNLTAIIDDLQALGLAQ